MQGLTQLLDLLLRLKSYRLLKGVPYTQKTEKISPKCAPRADVVLTTKGVGVILENRKTFTPLDTNALAASLANLHIREH